jgi:hypothetical protein
MKMNKYIVKSAALASLGSLAIAGYSAPTFASPQIQNDRVITVFTCDGTYAKVDAETGKVVASGDVGLKPEINGGMDGCVLGDAHRGVYFDKANRLFLTTMATDARNDDNGLNGFRVVVLDPRTLADVAHYDIPQRLDDSPEIIDDPSSDSLVVKYGDQVQRLSMRAADRLKRLSLGQPQSFTPPSVKPADDSVFFTDALHKKFESLVRTNSMGKKFLDVIPVDSAGSRTAYTVAADNYLDPTRVSGIVVYDNRAKRVLSSFIARYPICRSNLNGQTPTVHLSPDGQHVIIEDYSWKGSEPGVAPEMIKSGSIAIYGADSGDLQSIVTLQPPPPAGFGHVLNFSDDGHMLYYAAHGRIYVIDLVSGHMLSTADLPGGGEPIAAISGG